MKLELIQSALRERKLDAWLFYDHHHRDPIGYRVLGLPEHLHVTRRWYYLIPASGEPKKLVHRIESKHLDALPGAKNAYSSLEELQAGIQSLVSGAKRVAMQYSKNNQVFLIGLVDAGTVELLRSFGVEIISSGDLVANFEAAWTDAQIKTHFAARDIIDRVCAEAFKEAGRRVRAGATNEFQIQQWIMEAFDREGLTMDGDTPIVGCNENAGNPHYAPDANTHKPIKDGDLVLLDMWARQKNNPDAVYYDITWTGVVGQPTARHREIFEIVKRGRDAGIEKVKSTIAAGKRLEGWEVDQATRDSIAAAGYGQYFVHRTGHSIGTTVHANGANMDNLETKDDREVIANSCFSIEPGIYLPEFGVRSEVNMLVRKGSAEVTGRIQQELVVI